MLSPWIAAVLVRERQAEMLRAAERQRTAKLALESGRWRRRRKAADPVRRLLGVRMFVKEAAR